MISHNGKEYARVSEVLQPFSDFTGIDAKVLKAKQELGTSVHEAIHDDIESHFPILSDKESKYFESYLKWKEDIKPSFMHSETRYFDDERMITGCIDALIKINSSCPILVDFKTSFSESPAWILQAHLYSYLLHKNNVEHAPRFLFVKLSRNGQHPKVYSYKFDANLHLKTMNAISDFWYNFHHTKIKAGPHLLGKLD